MGLGTGRSPELLLVETLVPLLAFLEDHSSHHSAYDDAQQRAEQEQEHLPACQRPASEIPRWVIHIVCKDKNSYRDRANLGSCRVAQGVTALMPFNRPLRVPVLH